MPCEVLLKALEKKGVQIAYMRIIKIFTMGLVRTQGKVTKDFPITTRLHQGLTLCPNLFILVLDMLIEYIHELVP